MKIIRLDRRFRVYQEANFTWAMTWPKTSDNFSIVCRMEELMTDLFGDQYEQPYYINGWRSTFGGRYFYIYVRERPMLTAVLLAAAA